MTAVKLPPIFTIGQRLRDAREARGHVLKQAASLCGYSIRMWIYWEHGKMIHSGRARAAISLVYPEVQKCT